LRDAESHISPFAPRVTLPDGYNARFILEKSSDRVATQPSQLSEFRGGIAALRVQPWCDSRGSFAVEEVRHA
jgi:hypothetical protein